MFLINGIEWKIKFVHGASNKLMRSDGSTSLAVTDLSNGVIGFEGFPAIVAPPGISVINIYEKRDGKMTPSLKSYAGNIMLSSIRIHSHCRIRIRCRNHHSSREEG